MTSRVFCHWQEDLTTDGENVDRLLNKPRSAPEQLCLEEEQHCTFIIWFLHFLCKCPFPLCILDHPHNLACHLIPMVLVCPALRIKLTQLFGNNNILNLETLWIKHHLKESPGKYINWSLKSTYWLNNLALTRNTTPTSLLGCGICKVIFICREIKELVSDSDKHHAYLKDPDDIDLNNKFEEQKKDEVEDLKHKCIYYVCFVLFGWHKTAKLGMQLHSCPRTQPPHSQLPEEDWQGVTWGTQYILCRGEYIALYISVIAYGVDTSFSVVLTAPVAMTWIGFVDPLQIGWTWPDPTPLSCWTPTAAVIRELHMMSQDDSYVLQSLIGTTLCS